ncbi:sigma-70 family RNA polymerase sigma factor [soil metagenome]
MPKTDPIAERLADGDPLAPRDLVERHYAELYRYAFAMLRDVHSSEDAVHDAFVNALEALGRYSAERVRGMSLRAWLYRITLNVVRNRVKKNREVAVEEVPVVVEGSGGREGFMDALDALGRLPERQRAAVALRYVLDLPYAEISEATGWNENTVKTLVRRGLGNMRTFMDIEEEKG